MQLKSHLGDLCLLIILTLSLSGCLTGKYKPVADMANLEVSFADGSWDGKKVPAGQQCNRFGGEGSTPQLVVKNIPANTNALLMEYSDSDVPHMNFGGHGKMGYRLSASASEVMVPSVKGHTYDLPEGFFLVAEHANPSWDTAGAYMPPCSGGNGNRYYVTVKAVYDAPEGEESLLLGKAVLNLGRY